jgi:TnpA family transposase
VYYRNTGNKTSFDRISNRREDHEISMLALHLIQNRMVYINTLMIQTVLANPR